MASKKPDWNATFKSMMVIEIVVATTILLYRIDGTLWTVLWPIALLLVVIVGMLFWCIGQSIIQVRQKRRILKSARKLNKLLEQTIANARRNAK